MKHKIHICINLYSYHTYSYVHELSEKLRGKEGAESFLSSRCQRAPPTSVCLSQLLMVSTSKRRVLTIGALLLSSYGVHGAAKVVVAETSSVGEAVELVHHNTALMGKIFPFLSQLFRR